MKISIITATYNSIQHISGVLDNIRQQSYPNIESIVIDGGSTDGTVEVLQQSNQVSQLISEKDNGIYDALNKGIQLATGEIIFYSHLLGNAAHTTSHFNLPYSCAGFVFSLH
jgi:glycosyltransferase